MEVLNHASGLDEPFVDEVVHWTLADYQHAGVLSVFREPAGF